MRRVGYQLLMWFIRYQVIDFRGSSCGHVDSIMDSHATGPRFKTRLVRYFLLSYLLPAPYQRHRVELLLVCVEGWGRISQSGLTQDIKMGSCAFQCDVTHQWIAQPQVDPVSLYCDGVGCHVMCLWHGISVWQHIGHSTNATGTVAIWPQMFKSDIKPKQTNK